MSGNQIHDIASRFRFLQRLERTISPWIKPLNKGNTFGPDQISNALMAPLTDIIFHYIDFQRHCHEPDWTVSLFLQLRCYDHGPSCRPWIKIHCELCDHDRWRVVRLRDRWGHWMCSECNNQILRFNHIQWAERFMGKPLLELEGVRGLGSEILPNLVFARSMGYRTVVVSIYCISKQNLYY